MNKKFLVTSMAALLLMGCNDDNDKVNSIDRDPTETEQIIEDQTWYYIHKDTPLTDIGYIDNYKLVIKNNNIYSKILGEDNERNYSYLYLSFTKNPIVEEGDNSPVLHETYPILAESGNYITPWNAELKLAKYGKIKNITDSSWTYAAPKINEDGTEIASKEGDLEITTSFTKKDLSNIQISTLLNTPVNGENLYFPDGSYCLANVQSKANQKFISTYYSVNELISENLNLNENLNEYTTYMINNFTSLNFDSVYAQQNLSDSNTVDYLGYINRFVGSNYLNHTYDHNYSYNNQEPASDCLFYNTTAYDFIKQNFEGYIR